MRKAIFWDLQGTLGGDAVAAIDSFVPYEFSKDALSLAKDNDYINIIITNQSKIARGLVTFEAYEKMKAETLDHFNSQRVLVDDFLCCPHQSSDNCSCKKPKTGLIENCVIKYGLDIRKCFVIGDMGKNEIIMAHNAGCQGVLVLTGGGRASLSEYRYTWKDFDADIIAENALEAVKTIISGKF